MNGNAYILYQETEPKKNKHVKNDAGDNVPKFRRRHDAIIKWIETTIKMRVQKGLKYSKFVWLKKANKKTLARIESVCTFVYTLIYEKIF